MSKRPDSLRHEALQTRRATIAYLDALCDGLERGSLRLRDGNGPVVLNLRGPIEFRVRASRKHRRVTLSLRLKWKEPGEYPRRWPLVLDAKR